MSRRRGLERLDRLLRQRVEQEQVVPGAVALVRRGSEVLFHEAYGFRQREPLRLPMNRETLFDLASVTKCLGTALCAMQLWESERLDLDRSIRGWFGRVGDGAKEAITCRQLLSHSSGLPSWRPYFQDYPAVRCDVPCDEIVARILAEPLENDPGSREVYSDLGFILLGRILEIIADAPLDELFQAEVARPLGLVRTRYIKLGKGGRPEPDLGAGVAATERCPWRNRILVGEVHDENCYVMGGVAGHAGLFSTAREIDRILASLLEAWEGRTSLFGPKGVRTFLRKSGAVEAGTWGLGWDSPTPGASASGRHFSPTSFGHNGFTGTSVWMDLERRVTVVLLTNRVHPDRTNGAIRTLRPEVHDAVMEEILQR